MLSIVVPPTYAESKKPQRRKYGDVNHLPVDHKIDKLHVSNSYTSPGNMQ